MNPDTDCSVDGARILFLAYYYPPSGLPGSHRIVKFVRNLENAHMHVLTVQPENYPVHVDPDYCKQLPIRNEIISRTPTYDLFVLLLKVRSLLTGKRGVIEKPTFEEVVQQQRLSSAEKNSFLQRFKDFIYVLLHFPDEACSWILPALRTAYRIVKVEKINVIIASGSPWSGLVAAYLLHKLTRVPFIADFRDPWVGNPYLKKKGWLLDRIERLIENRIIQNAVLISANTDPLRNEFIQRYPDIPEDTFIVLPNGFDPEDFINVEPVQIPGVDNSSSLILVHAGLLYAKRDPVPLFEALKDIEQTTDDSAGNIVFCQIGHVNLDYDIDDKFSSLSSKGSFVNVGQVPYDVCLNYLAGADVLVIVQPGTKTQVPSKLYDYLFLNRPILSITPLDGALGQMIQRYEFGHVFEPGDTGSIAACLKQLVEEKKKYGVLKISYSERNQFEVKSLTAKLAAQIKQISTKR